MPNKMLIDASHPEETRVIVLRGNRVEEFDFESANKKQLRGNIYLAKVTRVEPSLQAAFVDYGGNRHGFLAFSEIHPDYYQIPVADRQALLEEEARAERDDEDEEGRQSGGRRRGRRRHGESAKRHRDATVSSAPVDGGRSERDESDDSPVPRSAQPADEAVESTTGSAAEGEDGEHHDHHPADADHGHGGGDHLEAPSAEHAETPDHAEPVAAAEAAHVPHVASEAASAHAEAEASAEGSETPTEPVADGSGLELALVDHAASHAPATDDQAIAEALPDAPSAGGTAPVEPAAETADTPLPADHDSETVAAAAVRDDVVTARRQADDDEAAEDDEDDEEDDDDEDEEDEDESQSVEQIGGDAMEEVPFRSHRPRRHYKIQEVIKRRQVLLVQVVKEERGTKGAALTTYLSLAGRYSVLMPNTARGGGISRKITDSTDRKRLKSIAEELEVPEGMGIILRTAGASRTKTEVKRDFEYLLRMWETVREVTLKSTAPTLVYEEGSLIKRAIRDLYSKEIEEILVAGEDGYREAKEFMRMLMPSHAKSVQLFREAQPIFTYAGAEAQLDGMYSNQVTLRSGGYIVINQTEALVAIDVNSGRSTREHNIEDTALRTNLEAADEVARQLRLRDLAGLIVVDFIDMEEGRNNRAVERRMKEALKNDRARIQIGRISHFGLLEMSRQRIRTGVLEGSTVPCPHCMGAGMVRSTSSIALHVLRGLEDSLIKNPNFNITVKTRPEVALYILNQKRPHLRDIEMRFGVTITVTVDPALTGVAYYSLERGELATPQIDLKPRVDLVRVDSVRPIYDDETEEVDEEETEAEGEDDDGETSEAADGGASQEAGDGVTAGEGGDDRSSEADVRRRRRRRRRRGGRDRERDGHDAVSLDAPQPSDDGLAAMIEIGGDAQRPRGATAEDGVPETDLEGREAAVDVDDTGAELAVAEDGDGAATRPVSRRRRRSRRGEHRRLSTAVDAGDVVEGAADLGDAGAPAAGSDNEEQIGSAIVEAHDAPAAPQDPVPVSSVAAVAAPADEHPDAAAPETTGHAVTVAPAAPQDDHDHVSLDAQLAHEAPAPVESAAPEHDAAPPAPLAEVLPIGSAPAAALGAEPAVSHPAPAEARVEETAEEEPPRPKRSGWWKRAKATFGG